MATLAEQKHASVVELLAANGNSREEREIANGLVPMLYIEEYIKYKLQQIRNNKLSYFTRSMYTIDRLSDALFNN